MAVLITGGAGYIGSHTAIELLNAGYEVVIADNLINSSEIVVDRIKEISGKDFKFYNIDVLDEDKVEQIFKENSIEATIHFAALKAVGESVEKPLEYYHNNLTSTLVVLKVMRKYNVKNFVFSSSATVYGDSKDVPFRESSPLQPATNPYGSTKVMNENILRDLYKADNSWNIALLRYFNPIGAHESGLIGENPKGIPNNLMPYITKVAVGELKEVKVFGNDYDTPDGTGVRDYIHVVDLAVGHVKALDKLKTKPGIVTYNLGTGKGVSVLEMIKALSKACGKELPYTITARRAGDIAVCYADASKANKELGWTAERDLDDMCRDSWNWQSKNPEGYVK